jgi:hypothetical protein
VITWEITMPRQALAKALLDECAKPYNGVFFSGTMPDGKKIWSPPDLDTVQTVTDYTSHDVQKKYTHMYFAKYVGLWRAIRRGYTEPKRRLVSLGAGPGLCALGWLWDDAHAVQWDVELVDVLDWQGVNGLPQADALWLDVAGHQPTRRSGIHIPPSDIPEQVQTAGLRTTPIGPVRDAVVLLPFILNHCLGAVDSMNPGAAARLFSWLKALAASNTVVIADLPFVAKTQSFWEAMRLNLSASGAPNDFSFAADVTPLQGCYSSQGGRRVSPSMLRAVVMVGRSTGWKFI